MSVISKSLQDVRRGRRRGPAARTKTEGRWARRSSICQAAGVAVPTGGDDL